MAASAIPGVVQVGENAFGPENILRRRPLPLMPWWDHGGDFLQKGGCWKSSCDTPCFHGKAAITKASSTFPTFQAPLRQGPGNPNQKKHTRKSPSRVLHLRLMFWESSRQSLLSRDFCTTSQGSTPSKTQYRMDISQSETVLQEPPTLQPQAQNRRGPCPLENGGPFGTARKANPAATPARSGRVLWALGMAPVDPGAAPARSSPPSHCRSTPEGPEHTSDPLPEYLWGGQTHV